MIELLRDLRFYDPDMNGSFSIKSVFSALFPSDMELDYKRLEIQNRGMAIEIFATLQRLKKPEKREEIRQVLLEYCCLDALAMVRIV